MEINASPDRLDLNDVNARIALGNGCRFVIDTDAHATTQLDNLRYGVFQARRAGLTKHDVLNALPYEKFAAHLAKRRGAKAPARAAHGTPTAPAAAAGAKRAPAAKPAAKRSAPAKAEPAKSVRAKAKPKPAKPGKPAKRTSRG
jgi:hypothetical protein